MPKRADAVGNGFDTCQSRRAGRERAEENEEGDGAGTRRNGVRRRRNGARRERALADPDAHHREVGEDEEVGRDREGDARLAYAPQVDDGDEDYGGDRKLDDPAAERGDGGGDREDPGGNRDGDREHVVDEESGRRNETRDSPEILFRDDIGTSARRVGSNGLTVGRDHDHEQGGD